MKKRISGLSALIIGVCMMAPYCQAKTGYVSDMLFLTFREGPGTNFQVLQTLKSNTRLQVIDEKNEFYRVELDSGEKGWVDKNFVMFEPPKSIQIETLTQENEQLKQQVQALLEQENQYKTTILTQKTDARDKAEGTAEELARLKQENSRLSQSLNDANARYSSLQEAAGDVTGTLAKNRQLTQENNQLSETIRRLETDSGSIYKTAMIKWFLAGFLVLLAGWLIGKSVSSSKRRSGSLLD